MKEFTNIARESTRKRAEKFIPIKINPEHANLQGRLDYLRKFRKQHHQLQTMVKPLASEMRVVVAGERGVSSGRGIDMDAEVSVSLLHSLDALLISILQVRHAYDTVKDVDVLEVQVGTSSYLARSLPPPDDDRIAEGTEIWVSAEASYNERIARVENQIISRLRDQLGSSRNANEMFRVFSKFNALFVRPKIRGELFVASSADGIDDSMSRCNRRISGAAHRIRQSRHRTPPRPFQEIVPKFGSVLHVATSRSSARRRSNHLGPSDRTTTLDVHAASAGRARRRMGTLRRRTETAGGER